MLQHASHRFKAPSTILHGVPLKEVLGKDVIRQIGESFADLHSDFDRKTFQRRAADGLEELELSQRARHIGLAIAEQLPRPFAKACPILPASFGPELTKTEGNGLATFFYLPHAHVIVEIGLDDFENAMRVNYAETGGCFPCAKQPNEAGPSFQFRLIAYCESKFLQLSIQTAYRSARGNAMIHHEADECLPRQIAGHAPIKLP